MSLEKKEPLFTSPMEAISGLSINDLNKYLPAIRKVEDLYMTTDQMKDGVFLGSVSYTHLRAHETVLDLVCRLLL